MKSEKILIVDDEIRIVENISLCLEREGFQTIGAHDGITAVKLFEENQFDLVLLDLSMPGMDGFTVMEHIFELDKDAIIVMITGNASIESAVKALKIGAWDYIKKPFELVDLIKTVKNALAQRQVLTDKKKVSAQLVASEQQYGYIVNNSPDLIFTLDRSGCFTFVNYQFNNLLGLSAHDLIGTRFDHIVHGEDMEKAMDLIEFGKTEERPHYYKELQLRFKKRSEKKSKYDQQSPLAFIELKAAPVHKPEMNGDGGFECTGIQAVARDVTDRINLEDQLRQAQKMEALGTLAGGIAHDFNNVLMGIQGYTSLIKLGMDKHSKEYKKLFNIDEYIANGADMARQLLGFAQKNCHGEVVINLNHLLKMSAKLFGRTKKDILIETYLDKQLWGVRVDEGQIKQVLMNLFVNAWHAMPDGGKIVIRSENVVVDAMGMDELGLSQSGEFIKVTVRDTGIGMDDDLVTRIFDPFFTTKKRTKGTGLGLATTYGIIKGHNGVIQVKSKPDEGSSFMIYLPAESNKSAAQTASEKRRQLFSGKGTILLVDDEEGVIEVCSEMLENLGYTVKTALDGMAAVDILKSGDLKIDLVILDMVMPRINGQQTFEKIKAVDPDMKVLACSGYTKEEDIQEMVVKGCEDYILKPFDVIALSEKLTSVLTDDRGHIAHQH